MPKLHWSTSLASNKSHSLEPNLKELDHPLHSPLQSGSIQCAFFHKLSQVTKYIVQC